MYVLISLRYGDRTLTDSLYGPICQHERPNSAISNKGPNYHVEESSIAPEWNSSARKKENGERNWGAGLEKRKTRRSKLSENEKKEKIMK